MDENAYVVVFPSIFARKWIPKLIVNIKTILQLRGQEFTSVAKDDSVIIVKANDPVFASSAINLLFGVEQVAIAKQFSNEFNDIVQNATKIGANLLLKNETFYVKVSGHADGYLPKDLEIAITSSLIEKTSNINARPGTEQRHEKLLETFLTKKHAYVCVFTDLGMGGVPYNIHDEKILCPIFDEISSVSCLETIKQGFDVKLVVCYTDESELLDVVKKLDQIILHIVSSKIEIKFFHIPLKNKSTAYPLLLDIITDIIIKLGKELRVNRISLPISPLVFSIKTIDGISQKVAKSGLIPLLPLVGINQEIFDIAKKIGLGKDNKNMEKLFTSNFHSKETSNIKKITQDSYLSQKSVTIKVGPNNIYSILDSLGLEH